MKKILDDPARVVTDTLAALGTVHADLIRADLDHHVALRATPLAEGQVAVISGGGSGHEPLHAGFVGEGMLAAAVLGDIFASPSADQITAAARAIGTGAGVLFLVKNYTGDVLNFRLAAEILQDEGMDVAMVFIDDDAALPRQEGAPGRRGTAATVLVEKIVGARAAEGASLEELTALARRVVDASRSIGFALTSCTTPMAGRPTFDLGDAEVEFGVGIHGEAGIRRQPLTTATDLARQAVELLLTDLGPATGGDLLVFTNGLGATPDSELCPLHLAVTAVVREHGHRPLRHLVGSYVTSLDMAGASVTLLALDDELTRLWDAPARTPALTRN
ncbi:dihydroxyacetone kinase subunit DhaK [Streptomyces mexicanus]|jgi:dihydroxyacetone kinase-like protein|uniref:dihydroxyacetone kinase subunit DhaK n=1 Tax=Streptomyces mexicanus TaxID=178566 RepID=UPI0036B4AE08